MSRHVSSHVIALQPEIWSIHVVVRTRTAKKCTKMKNARAVRAELLFLLIKSYCFVAFSQPSSSSLCGRLVEMIKTQFLVVCHKL